MADDDEFLLPCRCGVRVAVTASQAGARIACPCGDAVDVPSLGQLRRLGVADGDVSVRMIIPSMVAAGELPSTDECAGCRQPTPAIVDVWAFERPPAERPWVRYLIGALLCGWLGLLMVMLRRSERRHRDEREIRLPLRLCEPCHARAADAGSPTPYVALGMLVLIGFGAATRFTGEEGFVVAGIALVALVTGVAYRRLRSRRRDAIRRLLLVEPEYRRLLNEEGPLDFQLAERETPLARAGA